MDFVDAVCERVMGPPERGRIVSDAELGIRTGPRLGAPARPYAASHSPDLLNWEDYQAQFPQAPSTPQNQQEGLSVEWDSGSPPQVNEKPKEVEVSVAPPVEERTLPDHIISSFTLDYSFGSLSREFFEIRFLISNSSIHAGKASKVIRDVKRLMTKALKDAGFTKAEYSLTQSMQHGLTLVLHKKDKEKADQLSRNLAKSLQEL